MFRLIADILPWGFVVGAAIALVLILLMFALGAVTWSTR